MTKKLKKQHEDETSGVEGVYGPDDTLPATEVAPESDPSLVAAHPAPDYVEDDPGIVAGMGDNSKHLTRDWNKLLSAVGALGKENGQGKKSLVALAERVVEASFNGVIGTADDAAKKIYTKFQKEQAKAVGKFAPAQDEASKSGVSKIQQLIKIGKMPDDPWPVLEMARDIHVQTMAGDDKKYLRLKSTYEAIIAVAREQMKEERRGILMDEQAIRDVLIHEHEAKETTGLDLVHQALKTVAAAIDGRKASATKPSRDGIDNVYLHNAYDQLWHTLMDLDPKFRESQEKLAAEAEAAHVAHGDAPQEDAPQEDAPQEDQQAAE